MKKVLTYIFSLCLCLMVFAGCSLFEVNAKRFYSQTVAEIEYNNGKSYEFSMEDLLQAYNNYGYQLAENNSGLSGEDLLNQTSELMVQRHLLVELIKEKLIEIYPDTEDGSVKDGLTIGERNYVKRQVYQHINTQLSELEDEIRVEWDRKIKEEESTEEESTPLRASYNEYQPTVKAKTVEEIIDGSKKLVTKLVRTESNNEDIDESDPGEFEQTITDADISAEAMKRYVKNLQTNNKKLGKNYKDEEVVGKEIDRLYDILIENKYISKYQDVIYQGLEISSDAAVKSYIDKYKRDYELYADDMDAYHTAMASDASKVYYHPNSGHEYIYVTHILFKFSDEQTAKIEELKKEYTSNSITKEVYKARLKSVQSLENTIVTYDDNGTTKKISAQLAYEDIFNGVNKYSAEFNYQERTNEFNKYIYKYNDDEGIMNADFAYVVNLDTSVEDKMVKAFANESRRLYNEEYMGAMSEPILTEYGYHVIMYLKPVENVVEYKNIDNITWQTLYKVTTQPSSTKTLFHVEYDAINSDTTKITNIISNKTTDAQQNVKKINYWNKRIKKLLTIND